jgi:hypothetical protein
MTKNTSPKVEPVRLLFEMTRDDNPRLYDDLIRFNKGTKRVNRLRFLAHEGLLAQNWTLMALLCRATLSSRWSCPDRGKGRSSVP